MFAANVVIFTKIINKKEKVLDILIQITNQTSCNYDTINKKQNPLFGYF